MFPCLFLLCPSKSSWGHPDTPSPCVIFSYIDLHLEVYFQILYLRPLLCSPWLLFTPTFLLTNDILFFLFRLGIMLQTPDKCLGSISQLMLLLMSIYSTISRHFYHRLINDLLTSSDMPRRWLKHITKPHQLCFTLSFRNNICLFVCSTCKSKSCWFHRNHDPRMLRYVVSDSAWCWCIRWPSSQQCLQVFLRNRH